MQIIYRLYPNALHCSRVWTQFSSAIVTFLWIFNAAHWNLQLLQCMTLEVVFGHSASVRWNIESNTERKLLINFLPRPQATPYIPGDSSSDHPHPHGYHHHHHHYHHHLPDYHLHHHPQLNIWHSLKSHIPGGLVQWPSAHFHFGHLLQITTPSPLR